MAIPIPGLLVAGLSPTSLIATGVWFFPFLLASLSYYHYNEVNPERKAKDAEKLLRSYDFIVVGGGKRWCRGRKQTHRKSSVEGFAC